MYETLRDLLQDDKFAVVERCEIPGQGARHAPIPRFLFNSRIGLYLDRQSRKAGRDGPLWVHQAQALEALGNRDNVVLSTGTASGKSLVFRALAFHKTLLKPDSRIPVFYPLKPLAADQIRGWREMARSLELPEDLVGRIDGSVQVKDRENVLQKARIIVMTPDVCHAWLMSRLSLPVVRNFVQALSTVVMDEAHTLEGVFGSNFAFLLRRLVAARNFLLKDEAAPQALQLVAATATIRNPSDHLKQLTGSDFTVDDHEADGARRYERLVAHVACPVGEEFQIAQALHDCVLRDGGNGGFITFLDSRKGVEGLAMASGYGTTFLEYHEMSVEPSYPYLDNRFMQFAHGRCLAAELESLGSPPNTPRRVEWPRGFRDMHKAARPGGNRPPEYDAIAALGGDTPHYGYPLRNVGEGNFQIKRQEDGDSFGDVSQLQALRECYPGATCLH